MKNIWMIGCFIAVLGIASFLLVYQPEKTKAGNATAETLPKGFSAAPVEQKISFSANTDKKLLSATQFVQAISNENPHKKSGNQMLLSKKLTKTEFTNLFPQFKQDLPNVSEKRQVVVLQTKVKNIELRHVGTVKSAIMTSVFDAETGLLLFNQYKPL